MKHHQTNKINHGDYQRKKPSSAKPEFPVHVPVSPLVQLQRNLGNQAFGRFFQAKLTVNQPGDVYEQEADRVAEQVMRMPEPLQPMRDASTNIPFKMLPRGTCTVPPDVESYVTKLQGRGQPLSPSTRAFFEPRIGYDFSKVQIHKNPEAAASAESVNALAYTVGRDIVFGAGLYPPKTNEGKKLLAHELAHVVQQNECGSPRMQRFEAPIHESGERVGLTAGSGAITNEEASAAYFGNWMRDLNQVFVPLLFEFGLDSDVIFSMISLMAATKFGRELTPEQFGYYIPAEHIDNPAGLVAQDDLLPRQPTVTAAVRPQFSKRLGPRRPAHLDTPQESVDPIKGTVLDANIFAIDQTGVLAYIRRTNMHIERRLELAAQGGRSPEGWMHFGAASHAIEDLFAHSNWVEIAVEKLLKEDAAFLPQLTRSQRRVFTYSPEIEIGLNAANKVTRPVLTTGSFTSLDTQVSIASEIVDFLINPLPEPTTDAEREAEQRFVLSVIRAFQNRLTGNEELQQSIRDILRQHYVPDFVASRVHRIPFETLYVASTYLAVAIPEAARIKIQRMIRQHLSNNVLQPIGNSLRASASEARIADTSLIQVKREHERLAEGDFKAEEKIKMREIERITGRSASQQEQKAMNEARRHAEALQSTPESVVAGPSHSQLTKDHPNSPFFGIAFRLKTTAVQRLGDLMVAAWNERVSAPTMPFRFEWNNWPAQAAPGASSEEVAIFDAARNLFHSSRPSRSKTANESLMRGREIIKYGGDSPQPNDLAAMRRDSANRIRAVATAMRTSAAAPQQSSNLLQQLNIFLGIVIPERTQRLRQQLEEAAAVAGRAGNSKTAVTLSQVASELETTATLVERAQLHANRETANRLLVEQRGHAVKALATTPSLHDGFATAVLMILDEEIQVTAVSYTSEQRAVLEGRVHVQGVQAQTFSRATTTLPNLETDALNQSRSPALIALLQESRNLLTHPYEGNWWENVVRQYAKEHPAQLLADIEARNEGVPLFRRPGKNIHEIEH